MKPEDILKIAALGVGLMALSTIIKLQLVQIDMYQQCPRVMAR